MKKYRSIDGSDKRIVLPTGHITTVGAEWKELPQIFRGAALAAGCIDEDMAKGITAPKEVDRPAKIKEAIAAMVDADEPTFFNADGSPNMKEVNRRVGFVAKKEEVSEVWMAMLAEAEEEGDE